MKSLLLLLCRLVIGKEATQYTSPSLLGRRRPSTGYVDPLRQAAAEFALDVDNVGITLASASNPILLYRVPRIPELILLFPFLFVLCGHLQEGRPGQLPVARCVCRAMLDCRMSIANVSKVMDVSWRQKNSSSE